MQTPTIAAIETAIARAETMYGTYTCEPMPCVPGKFYVQHNTDANRCYIVDTRPRAARRPRHGPPARLPAARGRLPAPAA